MYGLELYTFYKLPYLCLKQLMQPDTHWNIVSLEDEYEIPE